MMKMKIYCPNIQWCAEMLFTEYYIEARKGPLFGRSHLTFSVEALTMKQSMKQFHNSYYVIVSVIFQISNKLFTATECTINNTYIKD